MWFGRIKSQSNRLEIFEKFIEKKCSVYTVIKNFVLLTKRGELDD
jgi:hypothetical protein